MSDSPSVGANAEELFDFLVTTPTPQDIVAFQPSEALTERVRYLRHQNSNGVLTPDEDREMEALLHLNRFMSRLKVRAGMKLKDN